MNVFFDECSTCIFYENQAGFRKDYSTIDNIFSTHILLELMEFTEKLHCIFVDFEKAFDNVWRRALWFKLLHNNIRCEMYDIILNMNSQIKSRIVYDNEFSPFFNCEKGVKQGEQFSTFLFLIYLNDLHDFLNSYNAKGLSTLSEMSETKLIVFLKLFATL